MNKFKVPAQIQNSLNGFIIQELFYFQRDIEWLDEGADVYETKMEEMKQK